MAGPAASSPVVGDGQQESDRNALVPDPIPVVPDVDTFLKLIGRGLAKFSSNIGTWEALFTLNSKDFIELGIKVPRDRRYLLSWLHRYRNQQFGPANDLRYIENGRARLCVRTDYKRDIRTVVNLPFGADPLTYPALCYPKDYRVAGLSTIRGPWAARVKDEAIVTVQAGMWEHKRGVKVDGGERRRKSVRFLKLVQKRQKLREEREAARHG